MRKICFLISMIVCLLAQAQSTEKLYTQGKALYDAKNYAKAFPLFQTAAQKGHKKAQYRLGLCYDKGRGVKEDDKQAFYWYGLSANQGYAKAQYQLGRCYKKGEGTTKDITKAVALFSKAAKQDNADGLYALGKCYLKGQGVAADKAMAKSLFQKAVRHKKDGKEILAKIREDAKDGDEDAKQILTLIGK